jgi:hypothetical protein
MPNILHKSERVGIAAVYPIFRKNDRVHRTDTPGMFIQGGTGLKRLFFMWNRYIDTTEPRRGQSSQSFWETVQ